MAPIKGTTKKKISHQPNKGKVSVSGIERSVRMLNSSAIVTPSKRNNNMKKKSNSPVLEHKVSKDNEVSKI
jgi:hypothetical protein